MSNSFTALKKHNRRVLMPFITTGYPTRERCADFVACFLDNGADLIELGIPFSDPVADGPIIQSTTLRALEQGITPDDALTLAQETAILSGHECTVLLSYFNPLLAFGLPDFMEEAQTAGVRAVLVADVIPEESDELSQAASHAGMPLGFLCSPTCTDGRIRLLARRTTAFIYLVAVKGVTGARRSLPIDLAKHIARVRRQTSLPLYVGFGISNAAQARAVAPHADGIIVGSALLRIIEESSSHRRALADVSKFLRSLRNALDE